MLFECHMHRYQWFIYLYLILVDSGLYVILVSEEMVRIVLTTMSAQMAVTRVITTPFVQIMSVHILVNALTVSLVTERLVPMVMSVVS